MNRDIIDAVVLDTGEVVVLVLPVLEVPDPEVAEVTAEVKDKVNHVYK